MSWWNLSITQNSCYKWDRGSKYCYRSIVR